MNAILYWGWGVYALLQGIFIGWIIWGVKDASLEKGGKK